MAKTHTIVEIAGIRMRRVLWGNKMADPVQVLSVSASNPFNYRTLMLSSASITSSMMPEPVGKYAYMWQVAAGNDMGMLRQRSLNPRQWLFVVNGHRVYSRRSGGSSGDGQRGQFKLIGKKYWTTEVAYKGCHIPPAADIGIPEHNYAHITELAAKMDDDETPVLADMLEDMGCTDQILLANLRIAIR